MLDAITMSVQHISLLMQSVAFLFSVRNKCSTISGVCVPACVCVLVFVSEMTN